MIDPSLEQTMTTSNALKKQQLYHEFLKTHCQIRTYTFQIKKCTSQECYICQPIRMPYDQFKLLSFLPDPEISAGKIYIKNLIFNCFTSFKNALLII